jgi:hypothetical protein
VILEHPSCDVEEIDVAHGFFPKDADQPLPHTPGSTWQTVAAFDDRKGGGLWWRRSPPTDPDPQESDPDPTTIDLCCGRGGEQGMFRIRIGDTVSGAFLTSLQDIFLVATIDDDDEAKGD